MKTNPISWVEIPVNDIERAASFYSAVLRSELSVLDLGNLKMALLPASANEVGSPGALVEHESYVTGKAGPLIYLKSDNISESLERVEKSGGEILMKERQVSQDFGYMAVFLDCEGNRMAFHSRQPS